MSVYTVTRDGEAVATFPDEGGAWRYLLRVQGQSVAYACQHGGWDLIYPDGSTLSATYGGAA